MLLAWLGLYVYNHVYMFLLIEFHLSVSKEWDPASQGLVE